MSNTLKEKYASTPLFGGNAAAVEGLYEQYLGDASAVPAAWRDYFDYFVFRTGENPAAHLPADLKDIVTSLNPDQAIKARNILSQRLKLDD